MIEKSISLLLTVPVCSFRKGYAREYFETEPLPPPSTIYGFLLSMVGEENRYNYVGTRIAYSLLTKPDLSVLLRTVWRVKEKSPPGIGSNRRPDYQELLTGLKLAIWVESGELAQRIIMAGEKPHEFTRYGGLSLGESRDLVNDIKWSPTWSQDEALWLFNDPEGDLPLPIWVDHVGSRGTIWGQFSLKPWKLETPPENDPRWICIISQNNEKVSEKN